jgi:3-oxoacyl-[acyl-carrier protein] reductase
MMLKDKIAVIYGGSGAIGGSLAKEFAREGARLFLVGRTKPKLAAVVEEIRQGGGRAEGVCLDIFDAEKANEHASMVAQSAGGIDISVNATGFSHVQGTPFPELTLEEFLRPVHAYLSSHFITAKAVASHMAKRGGGVILTFSTPGSRLIWPGFLGYGVTCAAKEAFAKKLSAELAPQKIRVVCIMPNAISDSLAHGSHVREVFAPLAGKAGISVETMLSSAPEQALLKRLPTLAEVAKMATVLASDYGASMTGAVVNMSGGLVVD